MFVPAALWDKVMTALNNAFRLLSVACQVRYLPKFVAEALGAKIKLSALVLCIGVTTRVQWPEGMDQWKVGQEQALAKRNQACPPTHMFQTLHSTALPAMHGVCTDVDTRKWDERWSLALLTHRVHKAHMPSALHNHACFRCSCPSFCQSAHFCACMSERGR